MMFCAYCGKRFARTEHLERHLPRHTNVKPHLCRLCQRSFGRRDLLKRHHVTYHEANDPAALPFPGGLPVAEMSNRIACANCAQAKSGCDRALPYQRCTDRDLECTPRYARRSSKKLAARSVKAGSAKDQELEKSPVTGLSTKYERPGSQGHSPAQLSTLASTVSADGLPDPRSQDGPSREISPLVVGYDQLQNKLFDNTIQLDNEFPPYDFSLCFDCPQDLTVLGLEKPGIPTLPYPELDDQSSTLDPVGSSPGSSEDIAHTRSTSAVSVGNFDPSLPRMSDRLPDVDASPVPEFEAVISAEAAWPLARCCPLMYSNECPQTAIIHLECLEQNSKREGSWASIEAHLANTITGDNVLGHQPFITPITCRTRDQILAVTQRFLQKTLEKHQEGPRETQATEKVEYMVLPPNKILEYFLRSYTNSLFEFYPLVAKHCVDPNEMLSSNQQALTLLFLLMIAQGAGKVATTEALHLSTGLTEMCRVSLCDLMDKNAKLSSDTAALRTAGGLLIYAWASWIAYLSKNPNAGGWGFVGFRVSVAGMGLPGRAKQVKTIIFHGILQPFVALTFIATPTRLVYNWLTLDHELSLLCDVAPAMAVSELQRILPGPEALWRAPNAEKWHEALNSNPKYWQAAFSRGPSLDDLFQDFLNDDLFALRKDVLTAHQLRLLLYPLHSLVYHFCHMQSVLPRAGRRQTSRPKTVATASMMLCLEEVQGLLRRWYDTALAASAASCCPVSRTNFVLYHLTVLNTAASIPDAECAARGDGDVHQHFHRSIRRSSDAVFHSGQVLGYLAGMRADHASCLPSWWSAALYRAVLVLWVCAMNTEAFATTTTATTTTTTTTHDVQIWAASVPPTPSTQAARLEAAPTRASFGPIAKLVAMDAISREDPSTAHSKPGGGGRDRILVLTRRNGSPVPVDSPGEVLAHGIDMLGAGDSRSRMEGGIARKLAALGMRWGQLECSDGGVQVVTYMS
ncbi:Transcriptional regulator of form adherence 5 [Zalerion maritima]|uniref:Transcriptional regulator of form adherence 5 n=1 Tax=Zalerion maritima TaxID=339359 RepID=A0AAD5WQH7_9PEZI|nr:Transcriptional regulator of form adherence 5 [Zalerion maritima]